MNFRRKILLLSSCIVAVVLLATAAWRMLPRNWNFYYGENFVVRGFSKGFKTECHENFISLDETRRNPIRELKVVIGPNDYSVKELNLDFLHSQIPSLTLETRVDGARVLSGQIKNGWVSCYRDKHAKYDYFAISSSQREESSVREGPEVLISVDGKTPIKFPISRAALYEYMGTPIRVDQVIAFQ